MSGDEKEDPKPRRSRGPVRFTRPPKGAADMTDEEKKAAAKEMARRLLGKDAEDEDAPGD